MEQTNVPTCEAPAGLADAASPARRPATAACAVLRVEYGAAAVEFDDSADAIEVLIDPAHPVFRAGYRNAQGARAAATASFASQERRNTITIVIDRVYFEQRARLALGNVVPKLRSGYEAADSFIREVGSALARDFRSGRVPNSAYLESLAGVIAVHLAIHHCEKRLPDLRCSRLAEHKLQRVVDFIATHLADTIRVRDLSRILHMSLHHFARMFRYTTGTPPHVYITLKRIERARLLLRDSDLPLVQVAASVGFQTQGHFTAVFHRHAGATPRVFRLDSRQALRESIGAQATGGTAAAGQCARAQRNASRNAFA
jgi:AraC family transcriptional regulator